MSNVVEGIEVFTLKEAAAFLRVSPEAVMRFVAQENLPGRQIEGQWRFLRTALLGTDTRYGRIGNDAFRPSDVPFLWPVATGANQRPSSWRFSRRCHHRIETR